MERIALAPVQADGKRRDFNDLRRPSQAAAQCRRARPLAQPAPPPLPWRPGGVETGLLGRTERWNPYPRIPLCVGTCHARTLQLASIQVAKHARRHKGSRRGRRHATSVADADCSVTRTRRSCTQDAPATPGSPTGSLSMVPLPDTRSAGSRQAAGIAALHGRCAPPPQPNPVLKDTRRRHRRRGPALPHGRPSGLPGAASPTVSTPSVQS